MAKGLARPTGATFRCCAVHEARSPGWVGEPGVPLGMNCPHALVACGGLEGKAGCQVSIATAVILTMVAALYSQCSQGQTCSGKPFPGKNLHWQRTSAGGIRRPELVDLAVQQAVPAAQQQLRLGRIPQHANVSCIPHGCRYLSRLLRRPEVQDLPILAGVLGDVNDHMI